MDVNLRIEEAIARVHDSAAIGLGLAAEHILSVSNQHVPHETGDLQGSGTTSLDEANLEAAIAYNTPYAARQHEELSWQHDPGRTAKYLENAVNAEANTAAQIIADTVRSELGN
jgi:hypothetical protein